MRPRNPKSPLAWMVVWVLCLFVPAQTAIAQQPLETELKSMAAERILPLVKQNGGGKIAVGSFNAAASIKGSVGPEVQIKLTAILADLQAQIDTNEYRFEITGTYMPYHDPDSGLTGVKLIGRLLDAQQGTTVGEFPRFIFGSPDVPRMLGLNVSTRGASQAKVQSIKYRKALEKPETFQLGTQIATSPSSPYAIELLVKQGNQYQPRKVTLDEQSRPFVEIKTNEVYAIRLINHASHEAAVRLSIDGISVFHFSQQSPPPTVWVVPPKIGTKPGVILVRGWDHTADSSLEFKVTDYPETAASQINLKPSNSTGMITASFCASWADEKDRPRDEGRTRGTGFGDEIVDTKTTSQRFLGHVRDTISVRYEK